jgi:hypothetical protein
VNEAKPTVRDCDAPWSWYQVGVDGVVTCCCFGSHEIGKVPDQSPEELWNSPTMQSLRASLAAGVVHSVCAGASCKYVENSERSSLPPVELPKNFDEAWYVGRYADVRLGIQQKRYRDGAYHYRHWGHREFREVCPGQAEPRMSEPRPAALSQDRQYAAGLRWAEAIRPGEVLRWGAGQTIAIPFLARNLGLRSWLRDEKTPGWVYGNVQVYENLDSVAKVSGLVGYRIPLPRDVKPDQSVSLELKLDPQPFLDRPVFLIVDLGCDDRFCFSDSPDSVSLPLVARLYRDPQSQETVLETSDFGDQSEHERSVIEANRRFILGQPC